MRFALFIFLAQVLFSHTVRSQDASPVGFFSETSSALLITKIINNEFAFRKSAERVVSSVLGQTIHSDSVEYFLIISKSMAPSLPQNPSAASVKNLYQQVRKENRSVNFRIAKIAITWAENNLAFKPLDIFPAANGIRTLLTFVIKTDRTRITVDKDVNHFNTHISFINGGIAYAFREEGISFPDLSKYSKHNIDEIPVFGVYLWLPVSWLNKKLKDRTFDTKYGGSKIKIDNPFFLVSDSLTVTSDLHVDTAKYSRIKVTFGKRDLVARSVVLIPYLDECENNDPKCVMRQAAKQFGSKTYETAAQMYKGRRLRIFEPGLKVTIEIDRFVLDLKTDGRQSFVDGQNLIFFVSL